MKSETLYKLIEEGLLPQCFAIMKTKGESYSGQEDKLGNFKRVAGAVEPAVYCPGCGIELEFCVGWYDENDYEGMRCPEGCNLEDYYD